MEFERIADKKRVDFIVASIRNTVPAGGEVLDIGCGNGIITKAVGRHGYNVLGIDVSEQTIANAERHNTLPNVRFNVSDAAGLTVDALKYDAIICSEVLEHLQDPQQLLNVIHGSLKDEGILIVTVPNGQGPRELLVTRPVQSLQKSNGRVWKATNKVKTMMGYTRSTVQSSAEDLSHIQFFTLKSLAKLAASTNFKIETVAASNFIEQVFPFSLLFRKSKSLQKWDCRVADALPLSFTSGFMSFWKKNTPEIGRSR